MINELANAQNCPNNTCARVVTQCVDVSAPLVLTPTAAIGNITTACQGNSTVQCITNEDQTLCQVLLTQKVCLTIPVRYGVGLAAETPRIVCSDGECPCPCLG